MRMNIGPFEETRQPRKPWQPDTYATGGKRLPDDLSNWQPAISQHYKEIFRQVAWLPWLPQIDEQHCNLLKSNKIAQSAHEGFVRTGIRYSNRADKCLFGAEKR